MIDPQEFNVESRRTILCVGPLDKGPLVAHLSIWKSASEYADIIMATRGDKDRLLITADGSFSRLLISVWQPSRNRWLKKASRALFGEYGPNILLNLDDLVFSLKGRIALRSILKNCSRVDSYSFWFSFLTLYPRSLRARSVFTETGGDWIELSQASSRGSRLAIIRYKYLAKWILNRITVLVESQINRSAMISCGVRPANIRLVGLLVGIGDRPDIYRPTVPKSLAPFTILFVGRMIRQKGLHTLINAASILVRERGRTDLRFVLVGPVAGFGVSDSSTYFEGILAKVRSEGLIPNVTFSGYIQLNALVDLYSSAMVHVLPSIQDAVGSVSFEAMLCATPSIVTSTCGVSEFIEDGKTGFVVPPEDAVTLADRIEYLAKHNNECIEMGIAARERIIKAIQSNSAKTLIGFLA